MIRLGMLLAHAACLLAIQILTTSRVEPLAPEGLSKVISVLPTDPKSTKARGGVGAFMAARPEKKPHEAFDIVAHSSTEDKEDYRVLSVAAGVIAYCRMNGTETSGYGFTIVVEHNDGYYSLYAHLATKLVPDSIKLGAEVKAGDTIGYLADPKNKISSSGNVCSKSVPDSEKIQLHFEVFHASPGLSSTDSLGPIKDKCEPKDPTARFKELGLTE